MAVCTHLDQIKLTEPAGPIAGCEECLKTGSWWFHLRMCDLRHIAAATPPPTATHRHSRHDDIPSPLGGAGRDWSWCYVDQLGFVLDTRD